MRETNFDFIVVGLGPSGLMLTAYLSRMGHHVAAVERYPALYGLPRAGHVDDEIVRHLQDLGVAARFLPDAYPASSYTWFNGKREVLLNLFTDQETASGYASDYMMYQPVLEDALMEAVNTAGAAPLILRGHELVDFEQAADGVTATVRPCGRPSKDLGTPEATAFSLRGQYLLAADGARSGVRRQLRIPQQDLGFNEVWLDVDARVMRTLANVAPHQICDPARPIYIGPLGRRHHRWEWAILPGENPDDFRRPEKAWSLLSEQGIGPGDVEIVRQQVYTFEARVAERWRDGRVFLLGDAAHTMPPFMGQGACSGLRDAANLAWKLDRVKRGLSGEGLLDSYEIERRPHTLRWIEISMQVGAISCTLDVEAAAKRDAALLDGDAPPLPAFPMLEAGVIDLADGVPAALAGTPFPQREVALGGRRGLFDDLAGPGLLLIGNADLEGRLSPASLTLLADMDAKRLLFAWDHRDGMLSDINGFYAAWFREHRIVAAAVRPDHIIFGTAASFPAVDGLIARLAQALSTVRGPLAAAKGTELIDA